MPPNELKPLGSIVEKVRSKNAGPFWVSVDVFCGAPATYAQVAEALTADAAAAVFRRPVEDMKRFELPDLGVLKFSFPRPAVQGDRFDRDMHGAQYAVLLEEHALPWPP